MKAIRVDLGRDSYRAVIGCGSLTKIGKQLDGLGNHPQVAIVTARPIGRRYGRIVCRALTAAGYRPHLFVVPDGERAKSLRWASLLYDRLIHARFERGAMLLALGGGVVGDLTGFVASTYLRGIAFVQIPTTLVAQVDASIGGKTGINHPKGKNLIGTFSQPKLVFIDVAALRTLPKRELIGGLAEVVKYGVIADPGLFAYLERHHSKVLECNSDALEQIVTRSVRIKADVVGKDEREAGLRRILNYGHTLGHAIETATGYGRLHHGEAIAMGMEFAARLSLRLGLCNQTLLDRQRGLLKQIGLPTTLPLRIDPQRLLATMELDKKVQGGRIHFVLPKRLGHVTVLPVEQALVKELLHRFSSNK
jgi:3-dehydroquinate synthase